MAPLFAQPDRQMVTGFPLAITHRKEEINSKNKKALSLSPSLRLSLFQNTECLFLRLTLRPDLSEIHLFSSMSVRSGEQRVVFIV